MSSLDTDYYRSHYVATVRFHTDNSFTIVGGIEDKKALKHAKKQTEFCYVRDILSKSAVKLTLVDGYWVREKA